MPSAFETGARKAPAAAALALAAILALGACAQSPETIAPAPASEVRYAGFTCADLGDEMARLNRHVALLSAEQSTKRVNDAVGWTRFLGPAGSLSRRDVRSSIALGKGEMEAVERAMARRCPRLRAF